MAALKKMVITGPESTGKSALCRALAQHFGYTLIPEYARIYLEKHGAKYDYDLLLKLAKKHQAFQQMHLKTATKLVFLDTDLINYKVWSQQVFGKTHPWIAQEADKETNHIYLLTSPDLPWEEDSLRENPTNREELFELHLAEVKQKNQPFAIISGIGQARINNAVRAIEALDLV